MNADGSGLRQLTYSGDLNKEPTWSPDGSQIAFNSNRDGNSEIYVINLDCSGLQNLTNTTEYNESTPRWWGP